MPETLAIKLTDYPCLKCKAQLSEVEYQLHVDKKRVQVCDKCWQPLQIKLEKWGPMMQQFKF